MIRDRGMPCLHAHRITFAVPHGFDIDAIIERYCFAKRPSARRVPHSI